MICAAIGINGLDAPAAREFVGLLEPLPARRPRIHIAAGLVFGQLSSDAAWTPGRSASGRIVLFNGQLHNRADLRAELGLAAAAAADIYAAALDRWGEQADEHVVGHYCAVATMPGEATLRCSRSPIEAPPLHFRLHRGGVIAASLPRPLFWRDPVPRAVNFDRLARSLLVDFSDPYAGIYQGCQRLPQGTAAVVGPGGWREVWRYNLLARPAVRMKRPADYVAAARELLDAGVMATLDGATRPGVLLSSGLDSPTVAASALTQLGDAGTVYGFTYGPEADWSEVAPAPGKYVSEFPGVAEFAAMHPALRLEAFSNPGRDFRFGQSDLIRAMDCGTPSVGLCWPHHAIHQRARERGCDVLLSPNWGNETFSSNAPWALPEWLARGHWLRLLQALSADPIDRRPLWRQVLARGAMPWLPPALWRVVQRAWHGEWPDPLAASALHPDWVADHDMLETMRGNGSEPGRFLHPTRRGFWQAIMAEDGQDREQYSQGMEILYGIPLRDPAAYRPLVEFCFGLPTELFRRDGQTRWLAREMGRGRLPEALRTRVETGMHHPDWHARLAPALAEVSEELDRIGDDPDAAALLDLPRLKRLLAEWAEVDPGDHLARLPYVTALPIGVSAARFIAFAKGRNDI